MKSIINFVLYFCAATVLAQACIVGISAIRGNFGSDTVLRIVGLLNGIDIQGQRIEKALIAARETPQPSYEDIVSARAKATVDIDNRESRLSEWQTELRTKQEKLELEREQFDRRRESFDAELAKQADGNLDQALREVQAILEVLQPDQSKDQLLRMMQDGQTADVVAIVKGMPADKRKKILGEFTTEQEASTLFEIMNELRKGEPMASTIEQAKSTE